jgi:hypothetical protein
MWIFLTCLLELRTLLGRQDAVYFLPRLVMQSLHLGMHRIQYGRNLLLLLRRQVGYVVELLDRGSRTVWRPSIVWSMVATRATLGVVTTVISPVIASATVAA